MERGCRGWLVGVGTLLSFETSGLVSGVVKASNLVGMDVSVVGGVASCVVVDKLIVDASI